MKQYLFKTTATMKPYNNKNWWIDGGIITEKRIFADNVTAALLEYREQVDEQHYISISDNAIKNKSPMFIDTADDEPLQVGYVITGKTEFQKDSGEWSTQYIDLWVAILTLVNTDFEEVAQ